MPDLKEHQSANKTTVSELKLDVAYNAPHGKPLSEKGTQAPKQGRHAHQTKAQPSASVNTISMQNLQVPGASKTKPLIKVEQRSLVFVPETSKSTPPAKSRGYDFSSSTNSHFEGWVFAVPKKFKRKCSASSSTAQYTSSSLKTSSPVGTMTEEDPGTSQELHGTVHEGSKKRMNLKGAEWKAPCKESFVAGAPRPYIGTCPHNFEQLAKLSKVKQKFFLTQDPRKKYCLRNPEVLRRKAYSTQKEFDTITKMVKQAENLCGGTASQSSESFICDIIDPDNPMGLDFQGMDYKNTYERDEQELQNQRVYRRVCRYVERKRVKAETEVLVEEQLQRDRLQVPDIFDVQNRNEEVASTATEESVRFGKLFRSADKPFNRRQIAEEQARRRERYKDMYLRRKEKEERRQKQRQAEEAAAKERLAATLAGKDFGAAVEAIDDAIRKTFKKERMLRTQELQRRLFPHTLRETLRFKKQLRAENRVRRDEARVKQEFFLERAGKMKEYPEAEAEISSDTPPQPHSAPSQMSEQSSDDEDALRVGKAGDVFRLRGFHFKLGDDLRGKRHQNELTHGQRKEKGCITREQWLAELAPKKEPVKLDVEVGIEKPKSPDDPELVIFRPRFGFKPPRAEVSAVRQYREKRLGRHYDRMLRKNLKLVKPKLHYSVKKFNLISFLYGDTARQLASYQAPPPSAHEGRARPKTTLEYLEAQHQLKQQRQQAVKQRRLQLLGIPCREVRRSSLQTRCENSESGSDSDWVPEPEPDVPSDDDSAAAAEIARAKSVRVPMRLRCNMPAARHRDSTLRRHPRHPRDYLGERVPSALFDEAVRATGLPHLHRLRPDQQHFANVRLQKRPYTDLFDARHHHDHWDPAQLKVVDVHYQAKIARADVTRPRRRSDQRAAESFQAAQPACNAFVDMDLTLPQWDFEGMVRERRRLAKDPAQEAVKERTRDVCRPRDFVFHSRGEHEELAEFPGHREYLQFLQEIRLQLHEPKASDAGEQLCVDREALVAELEQDLRSIESCLTSLSSSECTNLTNDSGSFLLVEGKTKVPLDYIRKSLVPFEELQRSRFQTVPIDVDAEDANPFKVLPFSGQKGAQAELSTAKDSFFTFNTRLQNGLRLRLEVPVEDVRQKLLGRGGHKFPGAVTTDIDENYVDELKNRPSVKMFQFKTNRTMIKSALRLKFESMLIQGQIVRTKIYDRLNDQHWEQMQKTKLLYEKLFAKWEKKEYEAAMAIVYQVKTYYDMTDVLKREFRELERQLLILNMDIVYIEGDWIRRIMLQNFHYLLADQDWRYEHDWIHRVEQEGEPDELESFEESIAKRTTVNIRQREKDDAWAIKAFYEEQYLQNKHPLMIVFPDAESFLRGIDQLKAKTFVLLLELHFTMTIHTELQARLETFEEWCIEDLREKEAYVARKCAKKYFMADRADELRNTTMDFLQDPIDQAFNDETFNRDRSVVAEVWREIVPVNVRGSSDQELEPIEMVAMMSDVVLELISKFETIPVDKCRAIEANLRKRRAYALKLSHQAYQVEKRIEIEMKKVRKNLEPPFQKPKRKGRLPRAYIKKKVPEVLLQEKHISEHTKFFFRAFHDEGDVMQSGDARESLYVMDTIQEQIIPFYFDHFLKLNGYTPNYNFKTQAELRDGPEIDRLVVRTDISDLQQKMERWEAARKKTMEDNIQRNPKMYENVNF